MPKKFNAKAILIKSGIYKAPRHRRRNYIYILLFILTLGGLVPGVYYITKSVISFLASNNIQFNGNYLPTNLCKTAPFNRLSWCQVVSNPILVNYALTPLRDTSGENYQPHFDKGVDYANYGPNPNDSNKIGLIISPNLRYQYAYNTIVRGLVENAGTLNPGIKNVRVNKVEIYTKTYQGPLTYAYVDRNQLLAIARVQFSDNETANTSLLIPVVIYNTQDFYKNYLNFMVNFHQINNLETERDSIIMGNGGRNIVIPQQVWTKLRSDPVTNRYVANKWLYAYAEQMLNYFYFSNWQQFGTSINQLKVSNNPFRNFVLYSPATVSIGSQTVADEAMYYNDRKSVLSGVGSILFNPARPDNSLPYTPRLPLTQQYFINKFRSSGTVREPLNFYFLILPPEKSLLFYYQSFGNNVNNFYQTFNELISKKLDPKTLSGLIEKYPFLKDLSFAPFQPEAYSQGYEHAFQKSIFYTGLSINSYKIGSLSPANATLDLNINKDQMAFFYRYWNAVAGYNLNKTALADGQFNLVQNNPLPQNDFTTLTLDASALQRFRGNPTAITNYLRQQATEQLYNFTSKFQQDFSSVGNLIISNVPATLTAFRNKFNSPLRTVRYTFFGRDHGLNDKLPAAKPGDFTLANLAANPQQYTNANSWKTLSIYFSLVNQPPVPTPWPIPGIRYTLDAGSSGFTINWKIRWQ